MVFQLPDSVDRYHGRLELIVDWDGQLPTFLIRLTGFADATMRFGSAN